MRADAELVAAHYPGLDLVHKERDEFIGRIVFGSQAGIETLIETRIVVPGGYPDEEPIAYDSGARFPRDIDGHILKDGSCCLWLSWESDWDGRQPDAILRFIDQLVVFFHKQLLYEATGRKRWPGQARGHGPDGYKEYLCEALKIEPQQLTVFLPALANWSETDKYGPCPCGDSKKLRWCHGPAIEGVLRKVGRSVLERRVRLLLEQEAPRADDREAVVRSAT